MFELALEGLDRDLLDKEECTRSMGFKSLVGDGFSSVSVGLLFGLKLFILVFMVLFEFD